MNLKLKLLAVGVLTTVLAMTSCTGTDDESQFTRLAVLYDGGKTLAYTTLEDGSTTAKLEGIQKIGDGVDLLSLPGNTSVLLTRKTLLEQRDLKLENPKAWPTLPFAPCLVRTTIDPRQTYIMTLSDCKDQTEQQVGLYNRTNKNALMWTAQLPPYIAPSNQSRPPVNLGLINKIGLVTRPTIGGSGGETMRVSPRNSGNADQDKKGVVSAPAATTKIWDVTTYRGKLYAATDKGVQQVMDTGLPDPKSLLKPFGEFRWNRLWGNASGMQNVLAAWRADTGDLVLWDSKQSSEQYKRVGRFRKVSDLIIAGDSYMYVLADNKLLRFDIFRGLQNGNWRQRTMIQEIKDPKALTWMSF